MVFARWLLVLTVVVFPALAQAGAKLDTTTTEHPVRSPDGGRIAFSGADGRGLHVYDVRTGELLTITEQPSAGYAVRWSPDGERLGFKLFIADARREMPWQVPVVLDLATLELTALSVAVARAGVPTFADDGRIAASVGERIVIFDAAGKPIARHMVGVYANLVAISPDGDLVAFNDDRDAIWLLEMPSGRRTQVTSAGAWYNPLWSPDGGRLLVHGISGRLACIDLSRGMTIELPAALDAAWLPDAETIVYASHAVPDVRELPQADLLQIRCDGSGAAALTVTPADFESSPAPSPDGRQLVYRVEGRGLVVAGLEGASLGTARPLLSGLRATRSWNGTLPPPPTASPLPLSVSEIEGVPYMHQVYDTPNDFNGHWACNATSAMMTIAWRGILPNWDTTVSVPSSHVSHWGNYVSRVYDFGDHHFDESSADPNGTTFYGGYGYITRNDWADTKGYMRDYLRIHGLESDVDWSPSWDKLKAEVVARQPFVVLSSITTAGHYKVTIGNYTDQHSVVFNDPYGDKNLGYMNYEGAGAVYDWPGYNNGNASLNTVHCFIWSRAEAPQLGVIEGRVNDEVSGEPIAGVSVALGGGASTSTGTDGTYRFDELAAGSYTVTARADCYEASIEAVTVEAGATAAADFSLAEDGSCMAPAPDPADSALPGHVPGADTLGGGCTIATHRGGRWLWFVGLAGFLLARRRRRWFSGTWPTATGDPG